MGFFYEYYIKVLIKNTNSIKNNILCVSVNKEPDSICESVDDISKEELKSYKKDLLSRLSNADYDTYIKQFWVGLLEGDGTLPLVVLDLIILK